MRILLINEYRVFGGTEVQTFRELSLMRRMGHDVRLLTLDSAYPIDLHGPEYNIPIKKGAIAKALDRVIANNHLLRQITRIIGEFDPDVIHVNGVASAPCTVYEALQGTPAIQTLRDYSAICPKGTCVFDDGASCQGYMVEKCSVQCRLSVKERYKCATIARVNAARRRGVDAFLCPSQALTDACTQNGLPTSCLNNPFDFANAPEPELRVFSGVKKYLYYGGVNEHKGVGKLLDVWSRFSGSCEDAQLLIAGFVAPEFEDELANRLARDLSVEYLGVLEQKQIKELLREVYCVVVPSLWLENYPNTVLEALASKTLVIGSNRGGIPELIKDGRLTFDVLDPNSTLECIRRVHDLSSLEYDAIVQRGYQSVRENNTMENYYQKLMGFFALTIGACEIRSAENERRGAF